MKSFCPDVNVWIALAYGGHQHHVIAVDWFEQLELQSAYFCRLTQLGFLRLVTNANVMREDVRTQVEAWHAYDSLLNDGRVSYQPETDPVQIEVGFRKLTSGLGSSPKQWPDAYLLAFSRAEDLSLVTFDRGLYRLAPTSALLLS